MVLAACLAAVSCDLPLEIEDTPDTPLTPSSCVDYGEMAQVEHLIAMDRVNELVVQGSRAFVATWLGLTIFDLDPVQGPIKLKTLPIQAQHVAMAASGLCVHSYRTLEIFDVAPTGSAASMGKLTMPFPIEDLAVAGNYAYLASQIYGLWIVDIANPDSMRIVGSVDTRGAIAVAARGDLAAVMSFDGLCLVDISNPRSPQRIGNLSNVRYGEIRMIDRYLVGIDWRSIDVLDLADPASPELIYHYDDVRSSFRDVAFDGSRAYLCGEDLVVIDVSRPTSPTVMARLPHVRARSIAVRGDRIYLGSENGLMVVKPPAGRAPARLAWVNTQGTSVRVSPGTDFACLAARGYGLWVVDLHGTPAVSGRVDFRGNVHDVVPLDSTRVLAACGSAGLHVVEVGTRFPPRSVSHLSLWGESVSVALADNFAYLAQGELGFWVADVGDPLNIRATGSIDTPSAVDVAVREGHAWVVDNEIGLLNIDISDPRHPRIIGQLAVPQAWAIALAGDHALLATTEGMMYAIDISTDVPTHTGQLDFGSPFYDVAVDGQIAYLASEQGVLIADISDLTAPSIVGIADSEPAYGVAIYKEQVFVANGSLAILRPQCQDYDRGELR
jgi:hypothetical protein